MSLIWIGHLAPALAVLAGEAAGLALEPSRGPTRETPIRAVLNRENYPWYDRERDEVRPVLPDPSSWTARLGKQVDAVLDWIDRQFRWKQAPEPGRGGTTGSILPTLLFLVSGSIFLVLLWRLWQLHEPPRRPGASARRPWERLQGWRGWRRARPSRGSIRGPRPPAAARPAIWPEP